MTRAAALLLNVLFATAAIGATVREQTAPSIAFGGPNYLAGWLDSTLGPCVGRFGLDGAPLDGAGICLTTAKYASSPAIAFDGVNYIVTWLEWPSARVARISTDGILIDRGSNQLTAYATGSRPAIRSGGAQTLIVIQDQSRGGLQAILIDRSLTVLASRRVAEGMWPSSLSIAWNGDQWLIAFQRSPPALAGHEHYEIRSLRLSSSLDPLDPIPLEIGKAIPHSIGPRALWNGREFTVFWSVLEYDPDEIHARDVHRDGTLGEETIVVKDGLLLDAEWDGYRYALLVASSRPQADEYALELRYAGVTLALAGDRLPFARTTPGYLLNLAATADLVLEGDRVMVARQEKSGGALRVAVGAPVAETPRTRRVRP